MIFGIFKPGLKKIHTFMVVKKILQTEIRLKKII